MKNYQPIHQLRELIKRFTCHPFLSKTVFVLVFISSFFGISFAQTVSCVGSIADSGGAAGNYSNSENITETYCSDAGNQIKFTFTSFDLESNFDFLFIYDGTSTSSPLIGVYTNSASPGGVVSTGGCLTLVFQSDATTTAAGYTADITCVADCDIVATGNTSAPATCGNMDGTITVNAAGTQGTLEFSIDGGATFSPTNTFAGLSEGAYQTFVRYTDGTCTTFTGRELILSGCTEICDNGVDDDGDADVDAADMDCDNTIITCNTIFTDDGSLPGGDYQFDTTYVNTFCSANDAQIQATFRMFRLSQAGNIDTLIVYDGPDTLSTLLGKYYGTAAGFVGDSTRIKSYFQSTNHCLTFQFKSIGFGTNDGWEADITCTNPVTNAGIEICGNGIDDDFDGLVDFQDPDCPEALDITACQQGFTYYVPPVWRMDGEDDRYSSPAILCLSTNDPVANITLTTADGSYSRDITITNTASDTIVFDESQVILRTRNNNIVENDKGLIIDSDVSVQVLFIMDGTLNKNLMTVKGREAEGKSFRVGTQTNTIVQSPEAIIRDEHHFITVMGTEDDTNIEISSTRPIEGQVSPISINLDAGETYTVIDEGFNVTMTGALVTSDKDIIVASGSQHTSGAGVTEDDGGVDMLVPARSVGSEYVFMRGGVYEQQDYGIIVAIENNTVVDIAGGPSYVINAGEFVEVNVTGPRGLGQYVTTSHPAYAYQVSGLSLGEVGMAIVPAIGPCRGDQFAAFTRFNSVAEFALNIIIPTVGLATLEINGASYTTLPSATTQAVPSLPGFTTVTVDNADILVTNTIESDEFFNASLLVGDPVNSGTFGFITSFSEKVNILDPFTSLPTEFYVLDTICRNDAVSGTLSTLSCGNTDKIRFIEQGALGTAVATGALSFEYTSNGTIGDDVISVTVINEFGIQSTVCIGISIDSVFVNFDPAEEMICSGESVTITPDSIQGSAPFNYLWSTGETTASITVTPMSDMTYSVVVTDGNGCTGIDEVEVTIETSVTADAGPNVTICEGELAQLMATQPMGTTGMWSGGTGVFSDDTDANAMYTPNMTESDTVKLFWTLDGNSGSMCFSGADSMLVIITPSLTIDAGEDDFVCEGSEFTLADLNASINSATITTGVWSSNGNGVFMPGNTTTGAFPGALTYIPGTIDNANGQFTLTLTADDPNGTGPCSTGFDDVVISINETPVLACNDNLNISVNSECIVELNVDMLIENPIEPLDFYIITLKDEFGNEIVGTTLNSAYINRTIEYSVGYECGQNSCWGNITIEDKLIPDLEPTNRIIDCRDDIDPTSVGFPLPFTAQVFTNPLGGFFVENFDGCSTVDLQYEDEAIDLDCDEDFQTLIFRTYVATDEAGNSTTAVDTISIERITLADVILPSNYDDIELPSLACDGTYELTDEGYPAPSVTGMPEAGACAMIQSTYTDVLFSHCGSTYKVLREWLIFDWCTSESIKVFQTIKVTDQVGPSVICAQDDLISADNFSCNSGLYLLQEPETMDNCSSVTTEATVSGPNGESIPVINGNLIADLPLGVSTVLYTATDECGNTGTCSYTVTVQDLVPPTPVCEGHTKVSLNNVGTARLYATSIDDGSHDNCEIASIQLAKMTDKCGLGSLQFGEFVDFCCSELGAPIMVAFRVTDIYNNSNICMTEVTLEDKIAPLITAPSDLTISCTTPIDEDDLSNFGKIALSSATRDDIVIFDEENNGTVGMDGLALDNCGVIVTEEVDIDIDCGVGEIRRTFTAIDANNSELKAAAVQVIRIVNSSPFDESDINWPGPSTVSGCMNLDADESVTGTPTYDNEDCASIVSSFVDKTFTVVDSACLLILREWKVLDMCQFNANTGEGIFTYVQSIKLNNTIAPEFTSTCADTTICSFGECEGLVQLGVIAEDDCTPEDELVYSYTIDSNDDGVAEYSGNSSSFSRTLEDGTYSVRWRVEDRCGNINTCAYDFTVVDCKNPTPYCLGGISTALMNNVGEVEITAESFDQGSFDNCSEQTDLIFSFSSNVNETTMLITCDMLENGVAEVLELEMWVTDEAGNQDFCTIQLTVQDNFDVCPNAGTATISGGIVTDKNEMLKDAQVMLSSDYAGGNLDLTTDETGLYAFNALAPGLNYNVSAYKNDDMLNGITTLDIVLIQKHILGLQVFDTPHQYIAADVNKNNGITGADIVQVRKAILGYYEEFPDNTSWRFIDASHQFDENNYYNFNEYVAIAPLTDDFNNADLTAVKIGDINGNASSAGFGEATADTRTAKTVTLAVQVASQRTLQIVATENIEIAGLQMELEWTGLENADISAAGLSLQPFHYRMMNQGVRIAFDSKYNTEIQEGDVLFTLNWDNSIDASQLLNNVRLINSGITAELYNESLEVSDVEIETRENGVKSSFSLHQNTPNPFQSTTVISFDIPGNDEVVLQVMDASGKIIYTEVSQAQKGNNSITLDKEVLSTSGIYYYQLKTRFGSQSKKMILMK